MTRQTDILPCPYCGNEYTVLPNSQIPSRGQYVMCASIKAGDDTCGACGPSCKTEEEAIERWNSGPTSRIEGEGMLTGVKQITAGKGCLFALCKDGSVWVKSFYDGSDDAPWRPECMETRAGRDAKDRKRRLED